MEMLREMVMATVMQMALVDRLNPNYGPFKKFKT